MFFRRVRSVVCSLISLICPVSEIKKTKIKAKHSINVAYKSVLENVESLVVADSSLKYKHPRNKAHYILLSVEVELGTRNKSFVNHNLHQIMGSQNMFTLDMRGKMN